MSHEKDLKQQGVLINDVKAYQTSRKENIYYMVTLTHKKIIFHTMHWGKH